MFYFKLFCEFKYLIFKKASKFITDALLKTDGTNKLIEKGKACITPTNNPFWKYPEDVHSGVRTYLQEKNQKKLKVETTTNTLKIYIYSEMVRSGRFRSSYIKRIGRILRSALIGAGILILFIVNNGNILTDGRKYRRRLN